MQSMFFVYLEEIVGKKTLVKPTSRIIEGEGLMLTFFVRGGPSPARGYKTFFMLNSIEHEIFPAHKC